MYLDSAIYTPHHGNAYLLISGGGKGREDRGKRVETMVFSDRKFIVVEDNTDRFEKYEALTKLISANGGEIVPWNVRADSDVTPKLVVVSSTMDYERAEEMKRFMIPTVTEEWVHACIQQQKLVPMRPYSPDPRNYMKGVIACLSQLSRGDTEAFKAGILASGGDTSDVVTRYTTHVVATSLDTAECQLVVHSRENNPGVGIRLVKPEWIDACMSLNVRVDDRPYLLDYPEVSLTDDIPDQNLTGTFLLPESPRMAVQQSMRDSLGSNILDGRRVFFGNDLDLSERVDKTVKYLVETNGGTITNDLSNAQVYIGKWRDGDQYVEASKRRIVVGNITWLYWLMIHQKFEKPTFLLHYPEVKGGLPAMRDYTVCVTNYTGDARAYLQSLITAIGAKYSGKLVEKQTTLLIAAYKSGDKYEHAQKWGIPVVNHLWLEESYAFWQLRDPDSAHYRYFEPKLSMSRLIGSQHLLPAVLQRFIRPGDFTLSREHHTRQAKQRAGNWLHDAMIVEGKFLDNLRKGRILPVEDDEATHKRQKRSEPKPAVESSVELSKEPSEEPRKDPSEEPKEQLNGLGSGVESMNLYENSSPPSSKTATSKASKKKPLKRASLASKTPPADTPPETPTSRATSLANSQSKPAARRVMISGMDDPPTAKALNKIGLSLVKTMPVHMLIAPRFLKTSKFLQALAETEEFVTPAWLQESLAAGELLPTDRYHLEDEQLKLAIDSRDSLDGKPLFDGMTLRLDADLRDKLPTFKELVNSHGGKVVTKPGSDVTVGNEKGAVPWTAFIDAIQHMDKSFLENEATE